MKYFNEEVETKEKEMKPEDEVMEYPVDVKFRKEDCKRIYISPCERNKK